MADYCPEPPLNPPEPEPYAVCSCCGENIREDYFSFDGVCVCRDCLGEYLSRHIPPRELAESFGGRHIDPAFSWR